MRDKLDHVGAIARRGVIQKEFEEANEHMPDDSDGGSLW